MSGLSGTAAPIYLVAAHESIQLKSNDCSVLYIIDTFALVACWVLVALTVGEVVGGLWRERDRYGADLLLNICVLAAVLLGQREAQRAMSQSALSSALVTLVCFSQPILLLRLVRRFHPVATWHWAITISAAFIGAAFAATPLASRTIAYLITGTYFSVVLAVIANLFRREASRAMGAGAMRLRAASLGTWMHVVVSVVFMLGIVWPDDSQALAVVRRCLGACVFACYYVGLLGPRWLTDAWTTRELYAFLRVVSERGPDERAQEAATDLARAAARSITCADSVVMLFDAEREHTLVACTVGPSALRGIECEFGKGLLTDAIRRGTHLCGTAVECEPPLDVAAAGVGRSVFVVPIASPAHAWGALVIVHRVGSLFPDGDARVLNELCRHTAASLSHSRLLTVEIERLRREAAAVKQERLSSRQSQWASDRHSSSSDRPRVMVVEDEDGVREYLQALLAREGYRVILASGHNDALAIAESGEPFDLVVSDVMMPDGSGPELIARLRTTRPHVPAVFISGISREEFEAMAPGQEHNFLQKPFEGARLVGRIEALLRT